MSVYLRLPTYEKRPVVKAVVFYGRRYSTRLLNCYLERNLLRNGGLLSEVRGRDGAAGWNREEYKCTCTSRSRPTNIRWTQQLTSPDRAAADARYKAMLGWELQVLFVVNTADEDDLAYLPVLMERNAEYRRLDIPAGALSLHVPASNQ